MTQQFQQFAAFLCKTHGTKFFLHFSIEPSEAWHSSFLLTNLPWAFSQHSPTTKDIFHHNLAVSSTLARAFEKFSIFIRKMSRDFRTIEMGHAFCKKKLCGMPRCQKFLILQFSLSWHQKIDLMSIKCTREIARYFITSPSKLTNSINYHLSSPSRLNLICSQNTFKRT